MIVSIGTDICNYRRIEVVWQRFGDRFVERILGDGERRDFYGMAEVIRPAYLCKRFAAKEAVAKALGTGIGEGISWREIEVCRRKGASPQVELSGVARERAGALGVDKIHLSLSDEKDSALAFVVFESR
ncbi:holo-ACP synthase [Microbulbifer sp. OS29]|uniref:Holo-[acyl-carrier-protein] synthase n=1 Tax=Microbulbifer okhotskensis TaxID=2926617 RepID=A0A9X2J5Z7_9GAMM|nr:holo-ACP synthase [Microbulbifer okhotskensis]MCO1334919.1 holo-ACP synthase [Microbulbifer okhotskensis]